MFVQGGRNLKPFPEKLGGCHFLLFTQCCAQMKENGLSALAKNP
jgi:hypothetical protein